MRNIKLRELSEEVRKYLQTGSEKSKFNIESLKTIEREIDINVDMISKEEIDEFFDIYLGEPFEMFINPKSSNESIHRFLAPYLLREKYVNKELREIKKIRKKVEKAKEDEEKKLHRIERNFLTKWFQKNKISKFQNEKFKI